MTVPYIDIFAGPGGLSEGFARYASFRGRRDGFRSLLSIEKDPIAAQTLTMRTFVHQFGRRELPEDYYNVVRQTAGPNVLQDYVEWKEAARIVWNAELGQVPEPILHSRIRKAVGRNRNWVLLGGPPCQAYSLAGRSRMTGIGNARNGPNAGHQKVSRLAREKLKKFYSDHRHHLYREYLRIVAVHQPAVFVMENVKGILSSKMPDEAERGKFHKIFPQIRSDLSDPWSALDSDPLYEQLDSFRKGKKRSYRIYSFTEASLTGPEELSDQDFLIRSEAFGVPQSRHRVILLGVREDLSGSPRLLKPSPPVVVENVLADMPPLRSGLSKVDDEQTAWLQAISANFSGEKISTLGRNGVTRRLREITKRRMTNLTRGSAFSGGKVPRISGSAELDRWIEDEALGGILQHESRSHMNSDLGRYLFASVVTERHGISPKLDDWPVWLLPDHRNISVSRNGKISASGFHDRFRVQAWDRPATTITSHISKDGHYYIHPDPEQCRSLTVREAARLQTFADNYFFCGNRTQQYHQVGNAVPPYLAVQLAQTVHELLKQNQMF